MTLPTATDAKAYAIAEIGRLMRQYHVSVNDIAGQPTKDDHDVSLVTRILAYVGGTLMVAGLCIYLGMKWDHLDSVLRVALTLGPGVIAFIIAILLERMDSARGDLIATPLYIVSALFQTAGLFVFLDEFGTGHDSTLAVLLVCTTLAIQYLAVFAALRSPMPLLFTLIFAHFAFAAVFDKMGIPGRYASLVLGLSGTLIAGSLTKTRYATITGIGFMFSGFTLATAAWIIFEGTPYDILLIGIAGLMLYGSVMTRHRTMLFVAVMTMLGYLGYFTDEYFRHVVGWPIALMVFGFILIVAASYAVKLGRTFKPAG